MKHVTLQERLAILFLFSGMCVLSAAMYGLIRTRGTSEVVVSSVIPSVGTVGVHSNAIASAKPSAPSSGSLANKSLPPVVEAGPAQRGTAGLDAFIAEKQAFLASIETLSDSGLLDALRSRDNVRKIAAANVVANRSSRELVRVLLSEMAACEDVPTRKALAAAITQIDPTACASELACRIGLKNDRDLQVAAEAALLAASSPVVVTALVEWGDANSGNNYLGRKVGQVIAQIRSDESVGELINGLNAKSFPIVIGSAAALGAVGDPTGLQALLDRVGGGVVGDNAVKINDTNAVLYEAISRVANPTSLGILTQVSTQEKDPALLTAIGKALSHYTNPAAVSALAALADRTHIPELMALTEGKP